MLKSETIVNFLVAHCYILLIFFFTVIRTGEPPHTRNLVKTIPWKRHQMYMRMWKAQPVVGEDNHNRVRKETQARMLQKEEIKVCNFT